jgi:hypothetical protein
MKTFESLAFRLLAVGTKFFDTHHGETFRKVSATQAEFLTGGRTIEGKRESFKLSDEVRAEIPRGYQIADADGANIQGDDNDPTGYFSFEILSKGVAQAAIDKHSGRGLQLYAIYTGDIEEPVMVGFL